jgi:quinol monooxygenase YgiN
MGQEDNRYGLIVRFDLLDGHEKAFDALTAETVGTIRAEESGTLWYIVHTEPESPGIRVFYELYLDEAAFVAHEESTHVQRFLSERDRHLRRDPEVWRVKPFGGVIRTEADPESA